MPPRGLFFGSQEWTLAESL